MALGCVSFLFAEHFLWRRFLKIPFADRLPYRRQDRVLADARCAAQQQPVIDLLGGELHLERQLADNVLATVPEDLENQSQPWSYLQGWTQPSAQL